MRSRFKVKLMQRRLDLVARHDAELARFAAGRCCCYNEFRDWLLACRVERREVPAAEFLTWPMERRTGLVALLLRGRPDSAMPNA